MERSGVAWKLASFAVAMLAALAWPAGTVIGSDPAPHFATKDRAASVIDREIFGLPIDDATMDLLESGADIGTARWGFALTAQEAEQLDLDGRAVFENELDQTLIPYLRLLPTFAGVWIDQRNGGQVIVMLTQVDAAAHAAVNARMPDPSRGYRLVESSFTYARLKSATLRGAEVWAQFGGAPELLGVGIDTPRNWVKLFVLEENLGVAATFGARMASELGVPVAFQAAVRPVDTVCTSRDNCHTPMKPGIRVNKSAGIHTIPDCTMAFFVSAGTDEQWLTAGHCGYAGSNTWWHAGFGSIGAEVATLYSAGNHDIMRVAMSYAQVGANVYGESYGPIGGWGLANVGNTVYASRGRSNNVISGTVIDDWLSWVSDTADPDITVWGADTTLSSQKGDSGSPVYRRLSNELWAIGTLSNTNGNIGRIEDAIDHWAVSVWSP